MEQMQNRNDIPAEEQEIDLVELVRKMWINRALIVKITCAFMVLGVLVALFSSKVYTASCDFVPQTSDSSSSSRMNSLAALAGINLNQMQDVKTLSPYVYENILGSTTFRKELMNVKLDYEKADRPVSFLEYNTSEEFNKPTVGSYIMKYTVGLPFVIINAIRGEQPEPDYGMLSGGEQGEGARIETLSKEEYECSRALGECLSLSMDDKKGYLSITVNMGEPVAAAQLAQAALTLLQRYITEFKIDKVRSNLDFVQERYNEAKRNFEDVQLRRAKFRDANRGASKHLAMIEQEKLDAEYTLAMNLYGDLAAQLEQAKINVKETAPILTVVNPVTVPYQKSKPRRAMILFAFTFLGAVAGMGAVLTLPVAGEIFGSRRMKSMVRELPSPSVTESDRLI